MASAARVHAVERGAVVNQYTLIAFGGAAPLHAARVAEKIGVKRVIVPPNAGVGSAVGFLPRRSPTSWCAAATCGSTPSTPPRRTRCSSEMSARGDGAGGAGRARRADLRAPHGLHALCRPGPRDRGRAAAAAAGRRPMPRRCARPSSATTRALFERHIPDAAIEILSWSVQVSTEAKLPAVQGAAPAAPAPQPVGKRAGVRRPQRPGHRGAGLSPRRTCRRAAPSPGPAIVAEDETSTFISASFAAHIDASGCIVMDRKDA